MGRIEYKIKKLFSMRPYRFGELPVLYGVSGPTFRKWLMGLNAKVELKGRYYTIPQMEAIVEHLGMPYQIYDIDYDLSDEKTEKRVFHKPFEVRPYKWKELCMLYDVCPKTLKKWIAPFAEEIGVLNGGYYLIPQIEIIIEKIGLPYMIFESKEMAA